MLRGQSGLSHVLLPLQCLVLITLGTVDGLFILLECAEAVADECMCFLDTRCAFLLSIKAEQVLTLNCVLCLQCTLLISYADSFSDAHMQFFPTATRALP